MVEVGRVLAFQHQSIEHRLSVLFWRHTEMRGVVRRKDGNRCLLNRKRKAVLSCGETLGTFGNTFVGQRWREGFEGSQF